MNPSLDYLLLARDSIQDTATGEISAIRIFDTLYIPSGQESLIYTLITVGKIHLDDSGIIPSLSAKFTVIDPLGIKISEQVLVGKNINSAIPVTLNVQIPLLRLNQEGKYLISVSLSFDGINFNDLEKQAYFNVKRAS